MQFLKDEIQTHGITNVFLDKIGNCIVKIPSISTKEKKKTILVVAHADTACDSGEKVEITEDEKFIYGHGICDNSAGVIGLLTTVSLIKEYQLEFQNDLIFGFTVGEEGLGGKRGMKQIIKEYGKNIDAVVNVESHHIGRVTNQAIGQFRCKLIVDTKLGGHSFRDFGRPNANVILAQIISTFADRKLPQKNGKTTFNIGQMKGEGNVNAISKLASCLLEIRSENNNSLTKTKESLESIVTDFRKKLPDIEIQVHSLAETPAVIFPSDHRIYKLTMDVQKKLGIKSKINSGNTDGDVSLAEGIPTVTIGTSEGWNTHSLSEYMEKDSLLLGIKQAFMVVFTMASSF